MSDNQKMNTWLLISQRTTFVPLILLLTVIMGCSHLPVTSVIPENVTIARMARCDIDSPLAWHPAGEQIAFSDKGVVLYSLTTGERKILSADKPTSLSWSADGKHLAAAFFNGDRSLVEIHSLAGEVSSPLQVNGFARHLDWLSDGTVLVATAEVTEAAHGITLQTGFTRWDGNKKPVSEVVRSVTLTPQNRPDIKEVLRNTFHTYLAPAKDKMVYTKLIAPPLGRSWIEFILKDLATGQESEIAKGFTTSGGGLLLQNGEVLLYGDGEFSSRAIEIETDEQIFSLFTPGLSLSASADERYWFIDGTLLKNKQLFMSFTDDSKAIFSPTGDALLLKKGADLYFVSGLGE